VACKQGGINENMRRRASTDRSGEYEIEDVVTLSGRDRTEKRSQNVKPEHRPRCRSGNQKRSRNEVQDKGDKRTTQGKLSVGRSPDHIGGYQIGYSCPGQKRI